MSNEDEVHTVQRSSPEPIPNARKTPNSITRRLSAPMLRKTSFRNSLEFRSMFQDDARISASTIYPLPRKSEDAATHPRVLNEAEEEKEEIAFAAQYHDVYEMDCEIVEQIRAAGG